MINFLISLGLGLLAAFIDTAPMMAKKLDKVFILSAFSIWVSLGIIIPSSGLISVRWLNGLVIALLCAVPVIILVTKLDKKAVPVMLVTTAVLGSFIGLLSGILIR